MKTKLDLVKDFRLTMGLPVNDEPTELSRESRELHARNIIEEAGEILEAINPDGTINKLKARDVSGDLLYFALGLVAEAGLDWDEEECVLRVCKEVSPDLIHDAELRYIFEDIVEVAGQLGSPDMVQETAHMLCQYAIQIDAVIGELSWLDDDFLKIHAANMAKLWTKAQVLEKFNPPFDWLDKTYTLHFDDSTGRWAVSPTCDGSSYIVRLNGKVQKPPGWVPAQLEGGAV